MSIKILFVDVDGVLTNGLFINDNNAVIHKSFNTHDFYGLRMLYNTGVQIGAITGCVEPVTQHQFKRAADFVHLVTGAHDKVSPAMNIMGKVAQSLGDTINWDDVAFIGDDLNDLELLKMVGWPACPRNAQPEIFQYVINHDDGYVSSKKGGEGCVRDFVRLIVEHNKREKSNV